MSEEKKPQPGLLVEDGSHAGVTMPNGEERIVPKDVDGKVEESRGKATDPHERKK